MTSGLAGIGASAVPCSVIIAAKDEAAEIGFDIGCEVARLFEQHRRHDALGTARGEKILGIGKRAP